ncbi:hypothetical protein F0562_019496 [Nyssa sinensis]|uniref:Uncharacterized protein n=1 Tax=Nyssa sinensis TaxID=561372 RepID=A0A5J5BSC9_9ASTE|nr:hypothetical protein F0562_019496 [Nyssa sinensis]
MEDDGMNCCNSKRGGCIYDDDNTALQSVRSEEGLVEDLWTCVPETEEMMDTKDFPWQDLEEACEAEDFETTKRLSESLASVEKEKECLAIELRDAEADCDAVDSKM